MKVAPASGAASKRSLDQQVRAALAALEGASTRRDRQNLARFGITAPRAFGVSMANIQRIARRLGRDHALAGALWETGWYEARMLSAFVEDPARVTPSQMDRWCRDFDNWGICDTMCFKLFDQVPHAWGRVAKWSGQRDEFVRRAAFALLASLALHDRDSGDRPFLASLRRIERAAADERNFVKKGVSWALRSIGRRNAVLHTASVRLARRLAESDDAGPRWVGKDALRDLASPAVVRRLAAHPRARSS